MTTDRLYFEGARCFGEDSITFALTDDITRAWRGLEPGRYVAVSVSQEQALDSYNTMIECRFHLDETQARQLRDWLIAHFTDTTPRLTR